MAAIGLLSAALGLAVRAKVGRPGGSFEPPAREPPGEAPQPRDVVLKVYDIATPASRSVRSRQKWLQLR